jgi:HSF-type DNA-binding
MTMQDSQDGSLSPPSGVLLSDSDRSSDGSSLSSSASETSSQSGQQEEQQQPQGGNTTVLFPWKLHEMLQNVISDHKETIVSWLPEGRAFKVHNVPEFVCDILPLYFKQTKYKSFQRQLNLWGFERLTSGPHKGAYFHPQFVQQRPDWCRHLTRQRAKKSSGSSSAAAAASLAPASPATGKPVPKAQAVPRSVARRPIVVPAPPGAAAASSSSTLIPRQVSESSLESFGELLRELDTAATSTSVDGTLDLAEFEGFTFHLLEAERYEELNLEFKFQETSSGSNNNLQAYQPPSSSSLLPEEESTSVQTLLQELEQGTFGTPETNFEGNYTTMTSTA